MRPHDLILGISWKMCKQSLYMKRIEVYSYNLDQYSVPEYLFCSVCFVNIVLNNNRRVQFPLLWAWWCCKCVMVNLLYHTFKIQSLCVIIVFIWISGGQRSAGWEIIRLKKLSGAHGHRSIYICSNGKKAVYLLFSTENTKQNTENTKAKAEPYTFQNKLNGSDWTGCRV